jgi:hypothetical protein
MFNLGTARLGLTAAIAGAMSASAAAAAALNF